jgi:hypothetical protein
MAAVWIGDTGRWPTALIDHTPHPIVGVTPSGWLSIADRGWHRFLGTTADYARIAAGCNAAQLVALTDRPLFDRAVRLHAKRPSAAHIGGLEWIETGGGFRWIRVDDFTNLDVKAAFQRHLAAEGGKSMLRTSYNLGAYKIDETYAGADAWWRFARTWQEPSLTT